MKFLKKIPKITIALASLFVFLLIVLIGTLFVQNTVVLNSLFHKSSPATISIQNNQIVIQTEIASSQKGVADQFLGQVGLTEDSVGNMSFGFDQNTINSLNVLMPIKLELNFVNAKELHFIGTIDGNLTSASSLPAANYQLATGSAKLDYQGGSTMHINVIDPQPLIEYATSSGQLNLSSKLDPAVTNLGKVSTIEIRIENNKISGEILLK
jgi:hypothetical protein